MRTVIQIVWGRVFLPSTPLGMGLRRTLILLAVSVYVAFSIVYQIGSFDKRVFLIDLAVVRDIHPKHSSHAVELRHNTTETRTNASAAIHNVHRYELESWEIASALPQRDCNPPKGIPDYCCLGSISAGGNVRYNPQNCRLNVSAYDIANYTEKFLPNEMGLCDVCRMVDLLLEKSLSLSFLGDSMTRQSFVGLECEIRKRYQDAISITRKTVKADRSNIETKLAKGQIAWRYGLTETVSLEIVTANASTTIHFYGMYRPFDDMEEVVHVFNTSDIVVFDFGLHFMPKHHLEQFREMTTALLQASAKSTPHLLAWRETSAQHYDSPGGHFGIGLKHYNCVDMKTEQFDGVRLPLMKEIGKLKDSSSWNGTDSILFIPYREFTAGLNHLHNPSLSKGKQDCSHFCNTPFVWLPIWQPLRIGIEKFSAGLPSNSSDLRDKQ